MVIPCTHTATLPPNTGSKSALSEEFGCKRCINGDPDNKIRVIKEILIPNRLRAKPIDYSRELEAIAKFSQPTVGLINLTSCPISDLYTNMLLV